MKRRYLQGFRIERGTARKGGQPSVLERLPDRIRPQALEQRRIHALDRPQRRVARERDRLCPPAVSRARPHTATQKARTVSWPARVTLSRSMLVASPTRCHASSNMRSPCARRSQSRSSPACAEPGGAPAPVSCDAPARSGGPNMSTVTKKPAACTRVSPRLGN
jgi:hypothetical protein